MPVTIHYYLDKLDFMIYFKSELLKKNFLRKHHENYIVISRDFTLLLAVLESNISPITHLRHNLYAFMEFSYTDGKNCELNNSI